MGHALLAPSITHAAYRMPHALTRRATMLYSAGATAIAILHFAFILFVPFGGLLVLRWHGLAWIHLPAAVWGAVIEFMHWNCPLTNVELWFLRHAGKQGYEGGFIAHYLFSL